MTESARLGEIGFPEFTVKLVTDIFDALVGANLRQMEAYTALLSSVSQEITTYINETKDDFGPEQLLPFLAAVLPPASESDSAGTKAVEGGTLDAQEIKDLNEAVAIPGDEAPLELTADKPLTKQHVDDILEAVAKRLAANKYTLLKEMVKLGLLRLVVDHGVIETRLTFNTSGNSLSQSASSSFTRRDYAIRANVKSGTALSAWVKASASGSYSGLSVSSASKLDRDVSGSSVQIFGRVEIHFKTDFQPLAIA